MSIDANKAKFQPGCSTKSPEISGPHLFSKESRIVINPYKSLATVHLGPNYILNQIRFFVGGFLIENIKQGTAV